MLKILQDRFQQYVNQELPDVQAGFWKGKGTRDQIANMCWIIGKGKVQKKSASASHQTALKPLTVWITLNWGKVLKRSASETTSPVSLETCMWVKKQQWEPELVTTDWFKFGKGVQQSYILSPCLFNLYAEYIMWNAELNESQAEIKMARININNLIYADDTTSNGRK